MNGSAVRPVSWGLHAWAVMTAGATLVLLALGQLVTSFQAGMADPIWPTEPWYLLLIDWREPSRGYLIEHTHRIAAFTVGGLVSVLALWLWATDPNRLTRRLGLFALVVLLAGFGQFHGGLIAQRNVATHEIRLPIGGTVVTFIGLTGILSLAAMGLVRRSANSSLRFLGVVALVGVMVQGLFGGFRVMLNELVGTDLATIHGIFAQVVFCLLVSIAVLTGRPPSSELPERAGWRLTWRSAALSVLVFVQVVLGALVRHAPTPFTQRLHFLTAFLATALAVWMLVTVFSLPTARSHPAGRLAPRSVVNCADCPGCRGLDGQVRIVHAPGASDDHRPVCHHSHVPCTGGERATGDRARHYLAAGQAGGCSDQ